MRPANEPLRVALYARVSIERDGRSKSVDDQLAELRAWAAREGWPVLAEHRDDGVSASRYGRGRRRPGWQQVMNVIGGGDVDALLMWEISRASRDRPVFAALFAACVDAGVQLGTGGRLHDLTDPDDGFALDLGAALSVREAAVTSKRVRRAVESRAAAGRPAGSVPYGYCRRIDPETGRTTGREAHREQAPIVREIVRRLLAREPAHAIAEDLTRRGVPTGTGDRWLGRHLRAVTRAYPGHPVAREIEQRLAAGELPKSIAADLNAREVAKPLPSRWLGGNLTKMVLRPTYAGLRVHRGEVLDGVRGTWPPLITEAQHYQLRAMYADPSRDKFRNPTNVRHLLTGLARCGRPGCNGRMRVVAQTGRPHRYDCRICHKISRYQEPVDAMVERLIVARLSEPDVLATLAGPGDTAVQDAADEAARLRKKLDELRDAYATDELSLVEYKALRGRIEPRLADAERRARPRGLPAAVVDLAGPNAAERWTAASIADRRAVVDALVEVTILPVGKRGGSGFDPASVRVERKVAR